MEAELKIADLNSMLLRDGDLQVRLLRRGLAWLDLGSHEGLLDASQLAHTVEARQGLKIACLEKNA